MNLTLLIFYTALALGVSFLCSILEAVVLSIPNTQVAVWQKDGNRRGDLWSKLKADDAVKPLTAILTLNTIAHTMGAAGVGSEVQNQFGNEFSQLHQSFSLLLYYSYLRLFRRPWVRLTGDNYRSSLVSCLIQLRLSCSLLSLQSSG